jgi:hypothetical protein
MNNIKGVVVAIIAVWYFFLRKKKAETGYYAVSGTDGGETGYAANWLTNGRPNFETGYAGEGSGLLEMPESGYKAMSRTGTIGTTMCTPPQVWSNMAGACIDPSARVAPVNKAKVPFGVAGASGRVSGISGAGSGTTVGGVTPAQGSLPDCTRPCPRCAINNAPCITFNGIRID